MAMQNESPVFAAFAQSRRCRRREPRSRRGEQERRARRKSMTCRPNRGRSTPWRQTRRFACANDSQRRRRVSRGPSSGLTPARWKQTPAPERATQPLWTKGSTLGGGAPGSRQTRPLFVQPEEIGGLELAPARSMRARAPGCLLLREPGDRQHIRDRVAGAGVAPELMPKQNSAPTGTAAGRSMTRRVSRLATSGSFGISGGRCAIAECGSSFGYGRGLREPAVMRTQVFGNDGQTIGALQPRGAPLSGGGGVLPRPAVYQSMNPVAEMLMVPPWIS